MKVTFLSLLLANGLLLWQLCFVDPAEVVSPRLSTDVPMLMLLEESDTKVEAMGALAGKGSGAGSFNSVAPYAPTPKSCFTVGPFTNEDVLKRVAQFFVNHGIAYRQRSIVKPELFDYNVILVPFSSFEEALATTAILAAKGVTDYYVMPGPELQNAISLGLFRERRFAVRHRVALERKGLSPKIYPRYRERSRHWLDYSETDRAIDLVALLRLSPGGDMQRLARICS